ncbi:uncharacterized protein ACR2FA_000664 [Aphomia sociella]
MNLEMDASNTDEYFVTAVQIFEYCGADSSSTLRVDALMDKFAPFIKTNKSEYSHLKSLLDPEHGNPEINVTMLAEALNKYSERQKTKVDFDESFNLKSSQAPHDSDSGISTDGFQLLEELQCELREKAHLAHQLRSQLEFTDRQHEEVLATITAERDSLRAHLNMVREENASLSQARRDCEEACERLCVSEQALARARKDLEAAARRADRLHAMHAAADNEKLILQELLNKSKEECHRINEMYASRQSSLLEENEGLKAEHAELTARLQDQEEFMQQIIKEKVHLEMELTDMLNKSNQTQLRLDRSIDISYTEDQMLTALDSLNADSRFSQDNRLLDEESFVKALKEEQGRATNISLFDEIRLSFCNMSRHNITDAFSTCDRCKDNLDNSFTTIGTQTDDDYDTSSVGIQTELKDCIATKTYRTITVQTEDYNMLQYQNVSVQTDIEIKSYINVATLTDDINNNTQYCVQCDNMKRYAAKLESDVLKTKSTVSEMQVEFDRCEDNLNMIQNLVAQENDKNVYLQSAVDRLESKLVVLEDVCANQRDRINCLMCDTCSAQCQTELDTVSVGTQVLVPCLECEKRNAIAPHKNLRKYLWEPLKCLFQLFAVICFVCAVCLLYGVSRRWGTCARDPRSSLPGVGCSHRTLWTCFCVSST